MQFINHTAFVFSDLAQSTFKLPDYKLFQTTSQKGAAMSGTCFTQPLQSKGQGQPLQRAKPRSSTTP